MYKKTHKQTHIHTYTYTERGHNTKRAENANSAKLYILIDKRESLSLSSYLLLMRVTFFLLTAHIHSTSLVVL